MTTAVQDALAELQTPGLDVGISSNGRTVSIPDPLKVCERLCEIAEGTDPATNPWPRVEGEEVEYVHSPLAREIGDGLIRDIVRLGHLRHFAIDYVLRNKDPWESNGRTVYGQMKRPSGLLRDYSGVDFIVLLNWPIWQGMSPMQRVALVYHELRHGDGEGKVRGHDFEGFFDELALFGTDTYRDWNQLAKAVGRGEDVRHQYSIDFSKLDTPAEATDEPS